MKKNSIHHIILFCQFIYVIISIPFIAFTRFTITTPDTFNYLLITEQLIQGNYYEAVSGHWSVGVSILIAPLTAMGVDGILAFKIVNALIGLFTLTLFLQIIDNILPPPAPRQRGRSKRETQSSLPLWRGLGGGIILPFILSMTLELTPDLLLTTLLLWYLKILLQSLQIFSSPQMTRLNYGWKCGLIAGLAYWAKAYALPFFVVHFIGINVLAILITKYKNHKSGGFKPTAFVIFAKQTIIGLFVFALISSPYIFALSSKFDGFSIGTSGTYNFALISPHRNHNQLTKNELIDPKTTFTDLWAYEEPAQFVKKWNPLASHSDRMHYVKFLWSNIIRFCYFDYARHLIIFLIISGLLFFYRKIKLTQDEWLFIGLMVFTAFVFTSGYFLILVRERYFWLDNFIGLIVLFFIGKILFRANVVLPPAPSRGGDFSLREKLLTSVSPPSEGAGGRTALTTKFNKKIFTLIIILASALLIYDSIEMIQTQTFKQSFYKNLHQNLPKLQVLQGKRVATNDTWGAYHHTDAAVYLMYKLRYQFWGQIRTKRLQRAGLQEAYDNDIDYFILWENPDLEESIFKSEDLIFRDTFPQMTVYKVARSVDRTHFLRSKK